MYMHYTVQLHCTLHNKNQISVSWEAAQEEDISEKWNVDLLIDLIVTYIESVQKHRKLSLDSFDTFNS